MMKVIFNNDNEHVLSVSQINYGTTFHVDNHSTRRDNLDMQLDVGSFGDLTAFENIALTRMQILNNNDEEVSVIVLPENFYMLSSNANFYEGSNSTNVNFGTINNE